MIVVFCLPGHSYSGTFLKSFTGVWTWCLQNNIQPVLSQQNSSMVNFARCKVAGADVNRGPKQKPFNGAHYDYMMWIDSDQTFTVNDFKKLLVEAGCAHTFPNTGRNSNRKGVAAQ